MDVDMNIDGFYYDPVKKRHFRIVGDKKYHPFQAGTINNKKINTTSGLKPTSPKNNVCQALTHMQIDKSGPNVQGCLLSARFAQMERVTTKKLEIIDYRGNPMKKVHCDYLIGEPENDSLYGVWSSTEGAGSMVQRLRVTDSPDDLNPENGINFDWRNRSIINNFPSGSNVQDLCTVKIADSPCSAVMCLTNHCKKDLSTISSVGIYYLSNDTRVESHLQAEDCSLNYEFTEPLYSCCLHTLKTLAIGGNRHIRLFTPSIYTSSSQPSNSDHTLLELKGRATSLKFSHDGKRLYTGTNNGYLVTFDVTSRKRIDLCNLKAKTIAYLHVLKNCNQLLVSCHDSKLFLIDTRKSKQPLLTFPGHVNDCRKIPVSVDESVDVVCSSGEDYCVRLWSIRSGKLLHEIPPPSNEFTNPLRDDFTMNYAWYSQSWKRLKGEPRPIIFTCMRDTMSMYYQRRKDDC